MLYDAILTRLDIYVEKFQGFTSDIESKII